MSNINAWKYGREVYLVGRSFKYRYLTNDERTAVIAFITGIIATRPSLCARLNLKYENVGKVLAKQNSYALLMMVQIIGRNLKVLLPTEAEKLLCDALFAATDKRRFMTYNDYQE